MQSKFWSCSYMARGTPISSFTADPATSALCCSLRRRHPLTPVWAGRTCIIFCSIHEIAAWRPLERRRGLEKGSLGFNAGHAVSDHCYCNHFILIHPYQPFLGLFSISLLPSHWRRLWPCFIMLGWCQRRSEWHCYPSLSLHHDADSQALLAPMDIAQQIFVRLVQTRYITIDLPAKISCLWLQDTSCLGIICSLK